MVGGKPRPVYAMLTTVKMRRLIKCQTLEDVIDFCVNNEFHGLSVWAKINVPTYPYVWDQTFADFLRGFAKGKSLRDVKKAIVRHAKIRIVEYFYV